MSEIAFKAVVQRSKETTIHRFRGEFSFDGIVCVLSHIIGSSAKRVIVEYDDDEGDRVRISSALEWAECVRLRKEDAVVRLFVRRGKGDDRDGARAGGRRKAASRVAPANEAADGSASENEMCAATQDNGDKAHTPVPRLELGDAAGGALPPISAVHAERMGEPQYRCESEADQLVLELLSILFHCDAARELLSPAPSFDFGRCVRRAVDPLHNEVHIDIDRTILRHRAIVAANGMIEDNELEPAWAALTAADRLFPQDPIIKYNRACVAALQGAKERAIELLVTAVDCGYDNAEHLKQDQDLASVISHPRVVALLAKLAGGSAAETVPLTAESEQVATEPTETPAADGPSTNDNDAPPCPPAEYSVDPNVRSVMSIFPHLSVEDIRTLLAEHANSVHRVVDFLLNA